MAARELPFRPPTWVTAPLSEVKCPHVTRGVRCGNNVLGRIKFPPGWNVYAVALKAEEQASGQGPLKQCRECHGLVEVVIRPRG